MVLQTDYIWVSMKKIVGTFIWQKHMSFIYVVDLLWNVSIQERRWRSTHRSYVYRLFLTIWDAFLCSSLLFFHLKTNKNKTKLNQQLDVKITMIGEGSRIPNITLLAYCNTQNIPSVLKLGHKQKQARLFVPV